MNAKQGRRLARLFDEATPPKSIYWEEGDPVPSVHISVRCEDDDLSLHMLCPEHSLVRFCQWLYLDAEGELCEWDDDENRLVPVCLTWDYKAEMHTWVMVAKSDRATQETAA